MIARATTTVKILGGVSEDPVFGDAVDDATVLAAGVLASLIENQRTARQPSGDNPRIIRSHVLRVVAGTVLTEDNQVQDERTGEVYAVVSVTRNANPQSAQDIRADLLRTGPAA